MPNSSVSTGVLPPYIMSIHCEENHHNAFQMPLEIRTFNEKIALKTLAMQPSLENFYFSAVDDAAVAIQQPYLPYDKELAQQFAVFHWQWLRRASLPQASDKQVGVLLEALVANNRYCRTMEWVEQRLAFCESGLRLYQRLLARACQIISENHPAEEGGLKMALQETANEYLSAIENQQSLPGFLGSPVILTAEGHRSQLSEEGRARFWQLYCDYVEKVVEQVISAVFSVQEPLTVLEADQAECAALTNEMGYERLSWYKRREAYRLEQAKIYRSLLEQAEISLNLPEQAEISQSRLREVELARDALASLPLVYANILRAENWQALADACPAELQTSLGWLRDFTPETLINSETSDFLATLCRQFPWNEKEILHIKPLLELIVMVGQFSPDVIFSIVKGLAFRLNDRINHPKRDLYIQSVGNEADLTEKELSALSAQHGEVPVLTETSSGFVLWGRLKGIWQRTDFSVEEGRLFQETLFMPMGGKKVIAKASKKERVFFMPEVRGQLVSLTAPLPVKALLAALKKGHVYTPADWLEELHWSNIAGESESCLFFEHLKLLVETSGDKGEHNALITHLCAGLDSALETVCTQTEFAEEAMTSEELLEHLKSNKLTPHDAETVMLLRQILLQLVLTHFGEHFTPEARVIVAKSWVLFCYDQRYPATFSLENLAEEVVHKKKDQSELTLVQQCLSYVPSKKREQENKHKDTGDLALKLRWLRLMGGFPFNDEKFADISLLSLQAKWETLNSELYGMLTRGWNWREGLRAIEKTYQSLYAAPLHETPVEGYHGFLHPRKIRLFLQYCSRDYAQLATIKERGKKPVLMSQEDYTAFLEELGRFLEVFSGKLVEAQTQLHETPLYKAMSPQLARFKQKWYDNKKWYNTNRMPSEYRPIFNALALAFRAVEPASRSAVIKWENTQTIPHYILLESHPAMQALARGLEKFIRMHQVRFMQMMASQEQMLTFYAQQPVQVQTALADSQTQLTRLTTQLEEKDRIIATNQTVLAGKDEVIQNLETGAGTLAQEKTELSIALETEKTEKNQLASRHAALENLVNKQASKLKEQNTKIEQQAREFEAFKEFVMKSLPSKSEDTPKTDADSPNTARHSPGFFPRTGSNG